MAKKGVQYIKPDEPAFLKRMKEQAGYKEGPTVETKRQRLDNPFEGYDSGDDADGTSTQDKDEEQPQVVVLKAGDLTAEQAKYEQEKAEVTPREASNERILFRRPVKPDQTSADTSADDHKADRSSTSRSDNNSKDVASADKPKIFNSRKIKNKSLLSFTEPEDV